MTEFLRRLPITIPRSSLPTDCIVQSASRRSYRLTHWLGEGAAGVVYASQTVGESAELGAIKILCPLQRIAVSERGYERIHSRFIAEARRGRKLSHPNLCRITDYGELFGVGEAWDGFPFYVMELVEGRSLGNELAKAVPSVEFRLKWIRQLGEALLYLHDRGILHRDIKPDNIIIAEPDKKLILGDFGVVHWDEFHAEYTDRIATYSSEILSTWSHLAPEVETGPSSYDLRSEAWAFGKTILEIARWSSVSRLGLVMGHNRPSDYRGPYGIEAAMVRLLENDPATRSTVADAMSDLQPYFELALLPASIPEDNFKKLRSDIRKLDLTIHGPRPDHWVSPHSPWNPTANVDKKKMLALVDRVAKDPDQHFRIDEKCPTCGSPLTVILAIYDDTPWDDVSHSAFLLGCFGYEDRSCGVHHGAWD